MINNYQKKIALYSLLFVISAPIALMGRWKSTFFKTFNHKNFRNNNLLNQKINENDIDYSRINAAVFYVTNEARVKKGKKPLEYSHLLEKAAFEHSKDMVNKDFFSNINPYDENKRNPSDRGLLYGIKNPNISENIASCFGVIYTDKKRVFNRAQGKYPFG